MGEKSKNRGDTHSIDHMNQLIRSEHWLNPIVIDWVAALRKSNDEQKKMIRRTLAQTRKRLKKAKKPMELGETTLSEAEVDDAIGLALPWIGKREHPFTETKQVINWVATKASFLLITELRRRRSHRCVPLVYPDEAGLNESELQIEDYRQNVTATTKGLDALLEAIAQLPSHERQYFAHIVDPEFTHKYKTQEVFAESIGLTGPCLSQRRKSLFSKLREILLGMPGVPWEDAFVWMGYYVYANAKKLRVTKAE